MIYFINEKLLHFFNKMLLAILLQHKQRLLGTPLSLADYITQREKKMLGEVK
jgi:hypothetical protein